MQIRRLEQVQVEDSMLGQILSEQLQEDLAQARELCRRLRLLDDPASAAPAPPQAA